MKSIPYRRLVGNMPMILLLPVLLIFNVSAQNVGIGTTNPEEKLHVNGNIIVNQKIQADDSGGLEFATDEGATRMRIIDNGDVGIGTINPQAKLHVEGTIEVDHKIRANDSGGLDFATDDDVTRMYIDDLGNVGIGTTNPDARLHVEGAIVVDQKIQADDSGGLEFATDEGTTRLFISDNGNVGIGTSSPGEKLHVEGTIEVDQRIQANDSGGLEFATMEGTLRLKIENGGDVGIGTTNPTSKLHVYGGAITLQSSDPFIYLNTTLSDADAGLKIQQTGTTRAWLKYDDISDVLRLSRSSTGTRNDLTINSSGMVGMGTASPGSHQLYVTSSNTGSGGSTGYFVNTANTGIALSIENSSEYSSDNVLLITSRGSSGNLARFDSFHGPSGSWDIEFTFTNNGDGLCDGSWQGSGADYAEYFPKANAKEEMQPGDVIAMSSDTDYAVEKANASKKQLVIGVYSSNPVVVGNSSAEGGPDNSIIVGLMGVVSTRVCTENGPIKIGDFVTTSSLEGVAAKAVSSGMVIGRAMENYNGASTGMIKVMVDVSWVEMDHSTELESLRAEIQQLREMVTQFSQQ
jgi:hypothetical protein